MTNGGPIMTLRECMEAEEDAPGTRTEPVQAALVFCGYCHAPFDPQGLPKRFCKPAHRAAYRRDVGLQGRVASNVQLMHGRISVTIHFPAEAKEMAQALLKGTIVWAGKMP